ncbi:dnaJ homolog subfamily C member 13-like, partial [Paramuricea clavata]
MAGEYDNDDVACYFTTKHSWRGKYKRVFSIGSKAITTYNPTTFEVTNQWAYKDFLNIMPSLKAPTEVTILVRKAKEGKKTQNMTFSTEHREDLITEALKFYKEFGGYKSGNELRFSGYKLHWSERKVPVTLEVSPGSLDQIDPRDNKKLCSYSYKDIELIALVSDYPGGFVVVTGGFSRMHLFTTDRREELLKKMMEASFNNVGVTIKQKKSSIKVDSFLKYKFGKFSDDEHITSMSEFSVYKQSLRSKDPIQRTLCFSEMCLLERDPATYNIVTLRPLSS